MSLPLVSIIIPSFNRRDLLLAAVESCLRQTFQNIEVVIIDDGSTDDTAKVLQEKIDGEWAGRRIRLVSQTNAGASAARNHGCRIACGTYLQYLDSDDCLDPTKIERQVEALENPSASGSAFCYCYGQMIASGAPVERIGRECETVGDLILALASRQIHVMSTIAPLWRTSFLRKQLGWREDLALGDDFEYHLRLLLAAKAFSFIPDVLFSVTVHSGARLSTEIPCPRSLDSALRAGRAGFDLLSMSVFWNQTVAAAYLVKSRTLYVNVLQFGGETQVLDIESWLVPFARFCSSGRSVLILQVLRKIFGSQNVAKLVNLVILIRNKFASSINMV